MGTTYHYSIDDTNGSTAPVTGNGVISSVNQQIQNINVSSLDNGTLTLTVYLRDAATNQGANVTDTVVKESTAPVLSQVTAVTTPTNDTTPNYTFSSTKAGTITYGGSCSSATTSATVGNNTITFNALEEGIYSDCILRVTDTSSNQSNILNVNTFVIDTTLPTITITAPTKTSDGPITNTTVRVIDAGGVGSGNVSIDVSSTATTSNFSCLQTSTTQIDCTFVITGSGDLVIKAIDNATNQITQTETGYTINEDTTPPTITNISSDKPNGTYTVGEVIDIDVTFSEPVTSTGNVTVTLETGTVDRTCTFTITNALTGSCNYTVQAEDISSDLNVSSLAGTIKDQSDNTLTNFTPVVNLSTNKAIVIDTTVVAPQPEPEVESEVTLSKKNEVEVKFSLPSDKGDKKKDIPTGKLTNIPAKTIRFAGNAENLAGGKVGVYDYKGKKIQEEVVQENGSWKIKAKFDSDGIKKVRLRFFDTEGKRIASSKLYYLVIHTEKPEFTDLPSALNKYPGDKIWWIAEDEKGIKKYEYTFNGKKKESNANHFFVPEDTTVGTYELRVKAYDPFGNVSEKKSTITVKARE